MSKPSFAEFYTYISNNLDEVEEEQDAEWRLTKIAVDVWAILLVEHDPDDNKKCTIELTNTPEPIELAESYDTVMDAISKIRGVGIKDMLVKRCDDQRITAENTENDKCPICQGQLEPEEDYRRCDNCGAKFGAE